MTQENISELRQMQGQLLVVMRRCTWFHTRWGVALTLVMLLNLFFAAHSVMQLATEADASQWLRVWRLTMAGLNAWGCYFMTRHIIDLCQAWKRSHDEQRRLLAVIEFRLLSMGEKV